MIPLSLVVEGKCPRVRRRLAAARGCAGRGWAVYRRRLTGRWDARDGGHIWNGRCVEAQPVHRAAVVLSGLPDGIGAAAVALGTEGSQVGAGVAERDADLGARNVGGGEVKTWELEERHVASQTIAFKGGKGCGEAIHSYGTDGPVAGGAHTELQFIKVALAAAGVGGRAALDGGTGEADANTIGGGRGSVAVL